MKNRSKDNLAHSLSCQRLCAVILVAWGLLYPTHAYADSIFEDGGSLGTGFAIEVGGVQYLGSSEFASTVAGLSPNVQGLVLRDRHGATARVIAGTFIVVAAAFAASQPKSVESKSYRSGDYIVTETTTTYRSPAEREAIMASAGGAASGVFFSDLADFELEAFGRDRFGYGDSSGYKLNMLFGGGTNKLYFEAGFGWGFVDSLVNKGGETFEIEQSYYGVPFRIGGAISKLNWTATWEWNWAGHKEDLKTEASDPDMQGVRHLEVAHFPLRLEGEIGLFGRVYAQGGLVFPSVKKLDLGYRLSAGFRF